MELVVATRNQGKLREIRHLLEGSKFTVLSMDDFPGMPEIDENGATFDENALKKARTVARLTARLTLADDSGLEVMALGGAPGVRSARYAGEGASDADNNRKLLQALGEVPAEERQASFVCTMALCPPKGRCHLFHGRVHGTILEAPRGEGGFGYDPLFLVREHGLTMAELPLEVKNRISHRGQALRKVLAYLAELV